MPYNYGKTFEKKVKEDWNRIPGSVIIRIPDQVRQDHKGTTQNICDYIAFANRQLFLLECKSIHGNTLNWSDIPQYERLLEYKNIPFVHPGAIIWFNDHDKVIFASIKAMEQMHKDGKKSINIKMLNDNTYNLIEIKAIKKRVFMECDFTCLLNLGE